MRRWIQTREWWSYACPADYDVVGTTIDIPVRDGITIACELRRPARDGVAVEGRFPGLVVEFSPYVVLHDFYCSEADFFAARGYNAIVATLRGIGGAGGNWDHGSFRQAGRDAHDLIEWLAAQPFCDGRVGMFGESFGGQTSYSAAVERPEHLVAIAPMQSPSSLYHDVVFPGGIKTTERGEIDNWPDIGNLTSGGVIDADAEFAANRARSAFDVFWRDRSFVDCLDALEVPVLAIGGWNDGYFRSGTLANIEALPARTWTIYGPWPHFFPVALVEDATWASADERADALAGNATVAVRRLAGVVRPLAHRPRRPRRFRVRRRSRRSKARSGSARVGASSTAGTPVRRPASTSVSAPMVRSQSAPTRPEACASRRGPRPTNPSTH